MTVDDDLTRLSPRQRRAVVALVEHLIANPGDHPPTFDGLDGDELADAVAAWVAGRASNPEP